MTYCVAMRLNAGLVFLADSRTNAGVDQISTFRKMTVFEYPGERLLVLLAAGNLAVTQAVRQIVCERAGPHDDSVWNATTMFEATRVVGEAVREVRRRDAPAMREADIEFNCNFIFGGQIKGEDMRLFQIYSAGNFIEATPETLYFQIGESKYGKPILDRVLTSKTPLDQAAKCVLVSMDSTLKSNLSVGLPLDLVVYQNDRLQTEQVVCVDEQNPYFQMIHGSWGDKLREVFESLDEPQWNGGSQGTPLRVNSARYEPMRKITHPGEKIV